MTDVNRSLDELSQRLSQIPESTLVEMVWALEGKRAGNHADQTALGLLGQFRPRLQVVRPARRIGAKRLFCMPFEDMLVNAPKSEPKIIGKIARAAIDPSWDLLVDRIGRTEIEQIESEIRGIGKAPASWLPLGRRLWPQCAREMRDIVSRAERNVAYRAEITPKLGGPEMYLDFQDAADAMEIAVEIQTMREGLPPKPIVALTDDDILTIGKTVLAVDQRMRARAPVVVYALVARLDQPTEILSIFVRVAEKGMAGSTGELASITTEVMVTDMEQRFETVRRAIGGGGDERSATACEDLAREIGRHLKGILRGREQLKVQPGASATRRLERVRAKLKDAVSANIVENASGDIAGILGDIGRLSGGGAADGDTAEMLRVEDRLLALQLAAKYAGDLGLDKEVKDELERVETQIDGHTRRFFAELRGRTLTPAARAGAEAELFASVRMLELVAGADKAEKTLAEGMGAMGPAGQA